MIFCGVNPFVFQSHIGAIRMLMSCQNELLVMFYFNPTLVQLESCDCVAMKYALLKFQSHIGAIRISTRKVIYDREKEISIPHWCN